MGHRCIYCGRTDDLSESDIIPDALTNARILNRNVCRIEHNNRFSDMFESKVIEALSFITNELDIKSSKGKKYAPYNAIITIEGNDYDVLLHGDNDIFNGRVLNSVDRSQKISSYDKIVKIAKDESKVQPIDVNQIEIEKKYELMAKYSMTRQCIGCCQRLRLNGIAQRIRWWIAIKNLAILLLLLQLERVKIQ